MKLKQIEIGKFRSIDHITIEIDNLAVLIGENNAGKSTILKAFELFYQDSVRGINEDFTYNLNFELFLGTYTVQLPHIDPLAF